MYRICADEVGSHFYQTFVACTDRIQQIHFAQVSNNWQEDIQRAGSQSATYERLGHSHIWCRYEPVRGMEISHNIFVGFGNKIMVYFRTSTTTDMIAKLGIVACSGSRANPNG